MTIVTLLHFPVLNPRPRDACWESLLTLCIRAWQNLTNIVYVEQPVGVGFTQGTPNVTNEVDLAIEFAGFWKNFMTAFELQGRKVYITGESYGR